MIKRNFYVDACWDDEAKVFYSKSDILGLHIEAPTLQEFEAVMNDVALELILANHIGSETIATLPPKEWMPIIRWSGRRQEEFSGS